MITPEEANGFLAVVYETMERMTKTDRKWFLKAVKMARNQMDFNYPNGKPLETAKEPSLIVPAGDIVVPAEGIIKP